MATLKGTVALRACVMVVLTATAAIAVYPTAAQWVSGRLQSDVVSGYISDVEATPSEQRALMLAEAEEFQTSDDRSQIVDPYGAESASDSDSAYFDTLGGRDAVIATIRIPDIGVNLPVFHDATDAALSKGVGHVRGTDLPVGGAGRRSALAAHSGHAESALFTRLQEVKEKDLFLVDVLGETHVYEVTEIKTVAPDAFDELQPEADKDLVTLITCTPTGVNTHRLLVTGSRLPDTPETAQRTHEALAAAPPEAGQDFPWWVAVVGAAPLVGWLATRSPRRVRDARRPRARRAPRRVTVIHPLALAPIEKGSS